MRPYLLLLLTVLLLCGCRDRPPNKQARAILSGSQSTPVVVDDAGAVIEKAIRAHGGRKNLARTLTGRLKGHRTDHWLGVETRADWEETWQLPRRFKRVIDIHAAGFTQRLSYVVDRNGGWIRHDDGPVADDHSGSAVLERCWTGRLAQLPGLLGGDWKRTFLGDVLTGGRVLVGVRVARDGEEAEHYFDKATGLLARSKVVRPDVLPQLQRWKPEFRGEKDLVVENEYGHYAEVSGVRFPWQLLTFFNGKEMMRVELQELSFLDTIDDRVFARPVLERSAGH